QTTALPPPHVPVWHVSPVVQALPSSHGVASGFSGFEQPVTGSQVPASSHWPSSVHTTPLPPPHLPLWHVSPFGHSLASSPGVASLFSGFELPLPRPPAPAPYTTPFRSQTTALPPPHVPVWHVSPVVQALPSSHGVASGFSGFEQPVTGSQVPA